MVSRDVVARRQLAIAQLIERRASLSNNFAYCISLKNVEVPRSGVRRRRNVARRATLCLINKSFLLQKNVATTSARRGGNLRRRFHTTTNRFSAGRKTARTRASLVALDLAESSRKSSRGHIARFLLETKPKGGGTYT